MTLQLPGFREERWVLDTSAAIELKSPDVVPAERQWDFWVGLLELVRREALVFPSQVLRELTGMEHPDMPGGWAHKAWDSMDYRKAPQVRVVVEVLNRHRDLVDPEREPPDQADPFVVALAIEQRTLGYEVRVVARDARLRAACEDFDIPTVAPPEFAELVEARIKGSDPS